MILYLAGYGKGGGEITDSNYFKELKKIKINKLFSFYRDKNSMKLYLAGGENKSWLKATQGAEGKKSLYSYYYLKADNGKKTDTFMQSTKLMGMRIFLDSGGFSAFTKGVPICIDEYCDFIEKYKSQITCYAQLDVIGDDKGTQKNLEYMKNRGLNPLPVFHYGGDLKRLDRLVKNHDYIALGGLVPYSRQKEKLKNHLDKCFKIIKTKCKVHGFGMTGVEVLSRYPFYSVDSTSWLGGSMRAEVIYFRKGKMIAINTKDKNKATYKSIAYNDTEGNKNWFNRVVHNAKEFLKLENYITKLWEKRGITWDS